MTILTTPYYIKHIQLNNRLVMPPMATAKSQDGTITDALIQYYDDKTKDEALGLVIMEHSYISLDGKASSHQVSIADDQQISGFQRLANVVHKHHTPIFAQINHAGSKGIGEKRFSASDINIPNTKESISPVAMNQTEIKRVIEDFTNAAKRVKEAGFDGVEIHSAHGYLLNQFYSPITNQRTDCYGGSILSRIRLHLEIIESIRKAVGEDFPIAIRLGACDFMDHGTTLEDTIITMKAFEKAGIDLLDISGGLLGYIRPNHNEEGYFSDITQALKQHGSIPVLLTGGIVTAKGAESLLEQQCADLIGVGRPILKDDHWAKQCLLDVE